MELPIKGGQTLRVALLEHTGCEQWGVGEIEIVVLVELGVGEEG